MQWLDPEPYPPLESVGNNGRDAIGDHRPCSRDVAVGRGSANEHEYFRAERRSLVDGPPIVVDSGRAFSGRCCRKHSASAQARDLKSRVADQPRRNIQPRLCQLVPPHRDPRYTMTRTCLDDVGQGSAFRRRLVEAQQPRVGKRGRIVGRARMRQRCPTEVA
jgi:hypothetical protein